MFKCPGLTFDLQSDDYFQVLGGWGGKAGVDPFVFNPDLSQQQRDVSLRDQIGEERRSSSKRCVLLLQVICIIAESMHCVFFTSFVPPDEVVMCGLAGQHTVGGEDAGHRHVCGD